MGMFDEFAISDQEFGRIYVQSKNFNCTLDAFYVGDVVDKHNQSTMIIHEVIRVNDEGGPLPNIKKYSDHPVRTVFIVIYRGVYVQGISVPFELSEEEIMDKSVMLQKSWEGPNATEHLNKILMENADKYRKSRNQADQLIRTIGLLVAGYRQHHMTDNFSELVFRSMAKSYVDNGYCVEDAVEKVISDYWDGSGN